MKPPVGKSGPGSDLQHFGKREVRILHQRDGRADDLGQVVRRNVRRHADRDTGRAVDQQVRHARRQNFRLLRAVVEVRT